MTHLPSDRDQHGAAVKRSSIINIRVSETEKHTISTHADTARLSISAYMRKIALEGSLRRRGKAPPLSEGRQLALILAQLGRMMDSIKNYHRLLKDSDENHHATTHQRQDMQIMLAALRRDIGAVRDHCITSMGKSLR